MWLFGFLQMHSVDIITTGLWNMKIRTANIQERRRVCVCASAALLTKPWLRLSQKQPPLHRARKEGLHSHRLPGERAFRPCKSLDSKATSLKLFFREVIIAPPGKGLAQKPQQSLHNAGVELPDNFHDRCAGKAPSMPPSGLFGSR